MILGAGGIGSVVAAHLAKTRHDVTLVARGEHLHAILERGLEVRGLRSFTTDVDAAETAAGACDLLVVATKTPDTETALASVASLRPAAALSLQNGLLKDRTLTDLFGTERVIGAATMIGASRTAPGVVEQTLDGVTVLGELEGAVTTRVQEIVDAWSRAGLATLAVDDVRSHEWAKQAIQAAVSPLAVMTNLPSHLIWGTRPLAESVVLVVQEVAHVAGALGIELSDFEGYGFDVRAIATESAEAATQRILDRGAALIAAGKTDIIISMLQDVRSGRRTEIDETAGFVVSEAERLGIETPRLSFACEVVRGIEIATGTREPTAAVDS